MSHYAVKLALGVHQWLIEQDAEEIKPLVDGLHDDLDPDGDWTVRCPLDSRYSVQFIAGYRVRYRRMSPLELRRHDLSRGFYLAEIAPIWPGFPTS